MDDKKAGLSDPKFLDVWSRVAPYTMTSPERGLALWVAVNAILDADVPGAFVECGVWKGGSSMLIALTLLQRGVANREIFLFDTFKGMTAPGAHDFDLHGHEAASLMAGLLGEEVAMLVRAEASLESVVTAMKSTGYDMRLVRFVEGDVRETLSKTQTLGICLLRLDTDFYDGTLEELRQLYPRLAQGGVLIVDDYGHWRGSRQAVEEYFAGGENNYKRPILWPIDYTGVCGVKIEDFGNKEIDRYDYHPPGIDAPDLLHLFPHAEAGNPWCVEWPYLRKASPHIWRFDQRNDGFVTGYASVEEAACLYALASQFRGKRGVEIGTHFGWTGAHLLAAGLQLDCIDPAFADAGRDAAIRVVFDAAAKEPESYRLWAGCSPQLVSQACASRPGRWSFAFIDGNHDGDAPRDDAREVLKYLDHDCIVVFHDLASPFVAKGFEVFTEAGFSTRLFNTMQILGVAWRGAVTIPEHVADPNTPVIFTPHLQKYLHDDPTAARTQPKGFWKWFS